MVLKQTIANDHIKLGAWMKEHYPALTASHLQKLCRTGQIRVEGRRSTPSTSLVKGTEVRLPPFIAEYEGTPSIVKKTTMYSRDDIERILASVVYEDDEIIAIDKPAGLAAQGGTGISKHVDELINAALPEYEGSLRLAHRIDKDTSGILLIAKGYDSALKLASMFSERKIGKAYLALVYGSPAKKSGEIDAPIEDENGRQKQALTNYKVMDEVRGTISLVELLPLSGRTHQLRAHMSGLGHPIVGDFKYGNGNRFAKLKDALGMDIPRMLMLHSWRVQIEGKKSIEAAMPAHMADICKYLNLGKQ